MHVSTQQAPHGVACTVGVEHFYRTYAQVDFRSKASAWLTATDSTQGTELGRSWPAAPRVSASSTPAASLNMAWISSYWLAGTVHGRTARAVRARTRISRL